MGLNVSLFQWESHVTWVSDGGRVDECVAVKLAKCAIYLLVLLLCYPITTLFQLYHGGVVIYQMKRTPEPTLLLNEGIFNLPQHIVMV